MKARRRILTLAILLTTTASADGGQLDDLMIEKKMSLPPDAQEVVDEQGLVAWEGTRVNACGEFVLVVKYIKTETADKFYFGAIPYGAVEVEAVAVFCWRDGFCLGFRWEENGEMKKKVYKRKVKT